MKLELIEKYIGDRKKKKMGPKAHKGYEWDDKKGIWRTSKKKKINESSELWFGAWSKPNPIIYIRNEEVLFSSNAEFPTGAPMGEEERKRASARGYVLLDW